MFVAHSNGSLTCIGLRSEQTTDLTISVKNTLSLVILLHQFAIMPHSLGNRILGYHFWPLQPDICLQQQ